MRDRSAVADAITDELLQIRQRVPGVRGSITATGDGLLTAHDVHDLEPTQIAALVAATHAVAVRASISTGCGQLKEVVTRGSHGYLAVYAAGPLAIVAVLGASDMNVGMLNLQARTMIDRIAEHAAGLARERLAAAVATQGPPGKDHAGKDQAGDGPLPGRPPAAG